jgi:ribonuclease Y
MKGRIIRREGRNIRALEHLTGVDFIIDDTPRRRPLVTDGLRREASRTTLEKLTRTAASIPRIEEILPQAGPGLRPVGRRGGLSCAGAPREPSGAGSAPPLPHELRLHVKHTLEAAHRPIRASELGAPVKTAGAMPCTIPARHMTPRSRARTRSSPHSWQRLRRGQASSMIEGTTTRRSRRRSRRTADRCRDAISPRRAHAESLETHAARRSRDRECVDRRRELGLRAQAGREIRSAVESTVSTTTGPRPFPGDRPRDEISPSTPAVSNRIHERGD